MDSRYCDLCGKAMRVTQNSADAPRCRDCRRANPRPRARVKSPDGVRWVCGWCEAECFRPATRGQVPKYCSKVCQGRAAAKRRDDARGVFSVSPGRRRRLYERDGYVCQICGVETSRVWSHGDVWSPTLDHIVPRSEAVDDSDSNLRTAHWFCNALRSDARRTDSEVRLAAEIKRQGNHHG